MIVIDETKLRKFEFFVKFTEIFLTFGGEFLRGVLTKNCSKAGT
ncbi:hypothetical protein M595_5386 [Lyngbya aestuarii BL J]|uniref:Uncharacterized protein n=1 Tax=Lyngbya aestuarii BL J TaxID=1348334 RepID=U7QCB4_9CYAN|nr:hypothetical protein M595_5386 [Lyngbya aestuarii BL J]